MIKIEEQTVESMPTWRVALLVLSFLAGWAVAVFSISLSVVEWSKEPFLTGFDICSVFFVVMFLTANKVSFHPGKTDH